MGVENLSRPRWTENDFARKSIMTKAWKMIMKKIHPKEYLHKPRE
jgi:hypothetical protein